MVNVGFGMFGWDFCCLGWCSAALLVFLDGFANLVVVVGFVFVLVGFDSLLAFLAFLCMVLILMLLNFRMSVCGVWVVCVALGV